MGCLEAHCGPCVARSSRKFVDEGWLSLEFEMTFDNHEAVVPDVAVTTTSVLSVQQSLVGQRTKLCRDLYGSSMKQGQT